MQVGEKYKIHCYKHNGKINQASEEAVVLDETDEMLVCGNNRVEVTEIDGGTYRTKELAIIFFYKKNWFNIIAQLKKYGLFYYCNIATPYIVDENVIKYIDYDLDLRVFPDGGLFSWVELPGDIDTTELLKEAAAYRVAFIAGAGFFVGNTGEGKNCMRISYGNVTPEKIEIGMKRLGDLIRSKL